jgi:hypothetical protein
MNDENKWYVRERHDGIDIFWVALQFKRGPERLTDIVKGPCTQAEAETAAEAHNAVQRENRRKRREEYWRQKKAKHEERMRTDPAYRQEEEERERKFKAGLEATRIWLKQQRRYEDERKAAQYLAHDVITAGYRAMSKKLHPDKGGDDEDMLVLEQACKLLGRDLPKRATRYANMSTYELRKRQKEAKANGHKISVSLKRELKKRMEAERDAETK